MIYARYQIIQRKGKERDQHHLKNKEKQNEGLDKTKQRTHMKTGL